MSGLEILAWLCVIAVVIFCVGVLVGEPPDNKDINNDDR